MSKTTESSALASESSMIASNVRPLVIALIAGLTVSLAACGESEPDDDNDEDQVEPFAEDCSVALEPGEDAEENSDAALDALINADEGDVICFNDGDYEFDSQLSLTVDDVEIRGESRAGVRLDFDAQDGGGNAIDVQDVENFQIRSLTVLNTPGNGIEVRGSSGVTFDDVAVDWEGTPGVDNGAYGLYPVQSEEIVIENSVVSGASDAGIYLGQSEYGIIRNNEVYENVAGIEVENSTHIDVHDNEAHDNTGGILVFNLPELQRKEGQLTRVFDNEVYNNNRENFADSSAIVSNVPFGTGVLVLSVQDVEIFDNTIENHDSLGVAVVSYDSLRPMVDDYEDEDFYTYTERIDVHSNVIIDSGNDPDVLVQGLISEAPVADIVWDGSYNDSVDYDERYNCFVGNEDGDGDPATYANFAIDDEEEQDSGPEFDESCERDPLDPVDF